MKKHRKNVYKRSDHRYEGRYITGYKGIHGKAIYRSIYADTYREIVALLEEAEKSVSEKVALERLIRKQKRKNLPVESLESMAENYSLDKLAQGSTPLRQCLVQWLEESKKFSVKASSYTRYCSIVYKHILPRLGDCPVNEVTAETVQDYIHYLCTDANHHKGLAPATIKIHLVLLSSFFEKMLEMELVQKNPCKNVQIPPRQKKKPDFLKQNEYQKLEKTLEDKLHDKRASAILLALKTGIRLGELAALRWTDIDLESRTVHIRHSLQRVKAESPERAKTEIVFGRTKSASSERDIPMNDSIYTLLYSYRKNLEKSGGISQGSFVFSNRQGSYLDPRAYQNYFSEVLKQAGIRCVNFHALRHTFATIAASRNMQISTLSRILGHSNPSITLQIYVHAVDEQDRIEMSKIESL
ncbi:tyrosine-type recombinase/integrase [Eubacterium sp. 1001713B170207_170306_E7]|uniref:tyrosine-type recombinase/integrase n=1 Tax=Eubacterium sp. 1001713B170207_170306_E7 TaxID=2787097 RepID=UPI0018992452|nr:tyrosine-type recombinase/integrase [Eubacterium sp. 1001713B170207_170306_E7]